MLHQRIKRLQRNREECIWQKWPIWSMGVLSVLALSRSRKICLSRKMTSQLNTTFSLLCWSQNRVLAQDNSRVALRKEYKSSGVVGRNILPQIYYWGINGTRNANTFKNKTWCWDGIHPKENMEDGLSNSDVSWTRWTHKESQDVDCYISLWPSNSQALLNRIQTGTKCSIKIEIYLVAQSIHKYK